MTDTGEFKQRLGRIESLLLALDDLPDTAAREAARALVRSLLDLHALGFRRVLELAGDDTTGRFAEDSLVGSLLVLHKLHPHSAAERMARALDRIRPRFHSLGGDVHLMSATDDVVQLRFRGDPMAATALRAEAKELVIEVVPDVVTVEFEEAWDDCATGRVSLQILNDAAGSKP